MEKTKAQQETPVSGRPILTLPALLPRPAPHFSWWKELNGIRIACASCGFEDASLETIWSRLQAMFAKIGTGRKALDTFLRSELSPWGGSFLIAGTPAGHFQSKNSGNCHSDPSRGGPQLARWTPYDATGDPGGSAALRRTNWPNRRITRLLQAPLWYHEKPPLCTRLRLGDLPHSTHSLYVLPAARPSAAYTIGRRAHAYRLPGSPGSTSCACSQGPEESGPSGHRGLERPRSPALYEG